MGKGAPKAPDPMKVASGQTATNVGTAIANQTLGNVNQVTPYGSLTYGQTGVQKWTDPTSGKTYELPQYTATQSFTPAGQKLQNATMATQQNLANIGQQQSGRIGKLLNEPMNMKGLPGLQSQIGNAGKIQSQIGAAGQIQNTYDISGGNGRKAVENALMQRMQPGLDNDRKALEQRLADQGIEYGSAAFQSAMDDANRQSNDARMAAVLAGGQEQSRMVGLTRDQAMFGNQAQQQQFGQQAARAAFGNQAQQQNFGQQAARASFGNQARSQSMQERFAQRNQPLNEIAALMSGSQVQQPNFVNANAPQMAPVNYAGIQQQGYENQMGQWGANWGLANQGLSAMGSILTLSDRRVKDDVQKVGKLDNGQPVYSYKYKSGGPIQLGLMAQDVKKRNPDAVKTMPGGIMAVDYAKATKGPRK